MRPSVRIPQAASPALAGIGHGRSRRCSGAPRQHEHISGWTGCTRAHAPLPGAPNTQGSKHTHLLLPGSAWLSLVSAGALAADPACPFSMAAARPSAARFGVSCEGSRALVALGPCAASASASGLLLPTSAPLSAGPGPLPWHSETAALMHGALDQDL